jgi:succinoglycan biosynthesis transport protein ExoP
MRATRRLPVLTTLPAAGPSPVPNGEPGLALHRQDWHAYEELLERMAGLGGPKIVLITGSDERIRSEVATGLGTASAVGGRRTLVMECDLARPALADIVGLEHLPGLREYLCWAASARELLQPVSLAGVATEGRRRVGQLVFVTAGRPAANGAALLASDSFPAALAKVAKAYDLVILPSGPLPSPELTAMAPEAEAMLVCIGPGQANRQGGQAIAEALEGLPEHPTGLIIHQRS